MESILITGANKGIGLAAVEASLQRAPDVKLWLGSRDVDRGHAALHALLGVPEAPALQNPGRFGALGVALRLLPCEMLTEQGNDLKS